VVPRGFALAQALIRWHAAQAPPLLALALVILAAHVVHLRWQVQDVDDSVSRVASEVQDLRR